MKKYSEAEVMILQDISYRNGVKAGFILGDDEDKYTSIVSALDKYILEARTELGKESWYYLNSKTSKEFETKPQSIDESGCESCKNVTEAGKSHIF